MTLRFIGMLMLIGIGIGIGTAHAVQPVEQGLQPILTRLQAISAQQKSLNFLLQSSSTMPRERAIAYRTYKQVDQERLELECSLERARRIVERVWQFHQGLARAGRLARIVRRGHGGDGVHRGVLDPCV